MNTAVDFFAGSGLVSAGLSSNFRTIWANDIDSSKAEIYGNNLGFEHLRVESISNIDSEEVPNADLYWASFPCQDLSLAGNYNGLSGERSSLVNEFFRIIDGKDQSKRPDIIVMENVYGLLTSNRGHDFIYIHSILGSLGYKSGAAVIDASSWIPQSRKRVFIIAVKNKHEISNFTVESPQWCHPDVLVKLSKKIDDFIFWKLPEPPEINYSLAEIIDRNEIVNFERSERYFSLIPDYQKEILIEELKNNSNKVFAGYKRTRSGQQRLELRFDEIAGCLRTATGGSSKQLVAYKDKNKIVVRFITAKEAARLMGAPEHYWLPPNTNKAYTAMGDAVAFPVTQYLSLFLNKITQYTKSKEFACA